MIKLSLFLLFWAGLSVSLSAQNWCTSPEKAKQLAQANNKLIMVDFWAHWCGPCKKLDSEVWSDPAVQKAMQGFIPLKIDVDQNRNLALSYGVTGIPAVYFIDCYGQVVHKITSSLTTNSLLKEMNHLPAEVGTVYEELHLIKQEAPDEKDYLKAGLLLQQNLSGADQPFKKYLKQESDRCFKHILKKDPHIAEEGIEQMELYLLLNEVWMGRSKKAIKQLVNKKGLDTIGEMNKNLAFYILAQAYDDQKMTEECAKYEGLISGDVFQLLNK